MIEQALRALAPELDRLDGLIHGEIARLRARYELSLDEFRGLYVSDAQVDELIRARSGDAGFVPGERGDVAAARAADTSSRWAQIARSLALADDERDVLLVLLAPEVDPKYETLYAYLNNDVTRKWPSAELVSRLLGRDAVHRVELRGLLAPDARLVASGVCEPVAAGAGRELPRAQRGWRVAAPVASWLLGLPYADERLTGYVRIGVSTELLPAQALATEVAAALDRAAARLAAGVPLPPLVLTAGAATEAALAAEHVFAKAQRPAIVLDLAALRGASAPAEVFAAAELLQCVLGIGIIAVPLDALEEGEGHVLEAVATPLKRLARRSQALALAASRDAHWRELLTDLRAIEIALPELGTPQRAALWQAAIGRAHGAIDALADRFALGADRVFKAAVAARDAAGLAGAQTPTDEQLFQAARAVSFDGARGTTRAVSTQFRWDDLVAPREVKQRLWDVLRAIELRSRVLDEWGFAQQVGGGRGVRVLFAGASGTGKTMAAAILAKALHLELRRVELAAVVSKYIGETEKNLDRAFAAARRANALLFIDEADALLGKRSEVKDAHDRYANVEIAYLLQKMEDHEGVVILATNLAQNIDEAFSRRMQFVVEFPMPDVASRELLWRRMFPSQAPLADDLDFGYLARQFDLAGGDIRNIVLDSAYRAAQEERPLELAHVLRAIARQHAKRGKVPTAAEFGEHLPLLMSDTELETAAVPSARARQG